MSDLKITLIKSAAHRIPKHRAIVKSLGLSKINSSVIKKDNPATRGQIFEVAYLIDVQEAK